MQRYDIKRFLQEAPDDLLQQYLTTRGLNSNLHWSTPGPQRIREIFTAISHAPEELHRQIHCAFQAIHQLSDAGGAETILCEMRRRKFGRQAMAALQQYPTPLGQSFWTFLNHPDVFSVSRLFRSADMIRRWHRSLVPPATPLHEKEAIRRLQEDLQAYYKENQDRGDGCQLQVHPRDSRRYWFANLQDYAEEVLLYDECHQLHAETLELAFEIIFVYDQQARTLAIATQGDFEHVLDLQRLFGRAVLNVELPGADTCEVYHLQRFLDPKYSLPLYPEDTVLNGLSLEHLAEQFARQGQGALDMADSSMPCLCSA